MQFLWKYLEDLVGKGLDAIIIFKLLFYTLFVLIPLTLPLAVLLSAIMSLGNLSENLELTALKASGVSFLRTLRPLLIVSFLMSGMAFIFSNYAMPWAALKQKSLLRDILDKKLEVNIQEGIFFTEIDGFSIRVGKKEKDGNKLKDVLIYKQSVKGNTHVIKAKSGRMTITPNNQFLLLDLYDGNSYEEILNKKAKVSRDQSAEDDMPHQRTYFEHQRFRFNLSSFQLKLNDEDRYKNKAVMMSLSQLSNIEDSLKQRFIAAYEEIPKRLRSNLRFDLVDTTVSSVNTAGFVLGEWKDVIKGQDEKLILGMATNEVNNTISRLRTSYSKIKDREKKYNRNQIEWHKKFTLSYACLVLFLVGAPLGAIIKRGGVGLPVVISLVFFIIYYILSIYGEKSVIKSEMNSFVGLWLANICFTPFGIFFMYNSATDSSLFDKDSYSLLFKRIIKKYKSNIE